jgi:hypothetical protein
MNRTLFLIASLVVATSAYAGEVTYNSETLSPDRAKLNVVLHDGKQVRSDVSYASVATVLKEVKVVSGRTLTLAGSGAKDVVGFDPRAYQSTKHPYRNAALNLMLRDVNGKAQKVHVLFKSSVNRGGADIDQMLDGTLASNRELSDLRLGHVDEAGSVK